MLSGLGHPSFKSLAAYKNNKNVTDSFSKFFFPSKGPTEDIIFSLQDKFFSFVAVGATNVGSIVIPSDEGLKTNQVWSLTQFYSVDFSK